MNWKKIARDYFYFTRKERIGLLVLLLIILVVAILPRLIGGRQSTMRALSDTAWISAMKRSELKQTAKTDTSMEDEEGKTDNSYSHTPRTPSGMAAGIVFEFDPNTLDKSGWEKLGVRDKTIHTILNYLNKGGHFYSPEDLKKIYGLSADQYSRLEPYVKIASTGSSPEKKSEYVKQENQPRRFALSPIDINTADTAEFIALPGIGAKLALRIVNFRDKLGGFYSTDQVGEIYGLADSVFQKIRGYLKLENAAVKKININTATLDELKTHPYIRYALAKPILSYRKEHGPFTRLEDIKQLMGVTEEVYAKISRYLTIDK